MCHLRALLISLLSLWAAPLVGQTVDGAIEGYVLDQNDSPVPSVLVTVQGPSLQGERSVRSDVRGYYRFTGVPVGTYSVSVTIPGYRAVVVSDVVVGLGRTSSLDAVRLETAAIELDPIEVRVEATMLDVTSATIGANLPSSVFKNLPIERDYQAMVDLVPHANATFQTDGSSLGGATGYESVFHIDGVNVTDPLVPGRKTRLPYNFVEEVRVKIGGYEAEFGQALGGIVDVVTHSGGDEFEGSVFGFYTHEALSTEPRTGIFRGETGGVSNLDVGASVSGPILKRRLWFYSAYNLERKTDEVLIPGIGDRGALRTSHLFAGKLSWRASDATDVTLSVFGDPTVEHGVGNRLASFFGSPASLTNPEPFLFRNNSGGYNASLRARHWISPAFVLEAAASRFTNKNFEEADTKTGRDQPLLIDVATGNWSGGAGIRFDQRTARNTLRVTGTGFAGVHTLKGGVEYQTHRGVDQTRFISAGTAENVSIIFDTGTGFEGWYNFTDGDGGDPVITAFLQDSWQASRRLRVNLGLRLASQYLVGAGGAVTTAFTNQFQPRLGFIFEPGSERTQKLFGSFGRYYLQLPFFVSVATDHPREECVYSFPEDPRDSSVMSTGVVCQQTIDSFALPGREDPRGEHTDEITLGYERRFSGGVRVAARGIHRTLREAYTLGFVRSEDGSLVGGVANPGRGLLENMPDAKREYTALELVLEKTGGPLQLLASYVLSRSYGNYPGQFTADFNFEVPGNQLSFQLPEHDNIATGLLPSDRTHVLKVLGAYSFPFGLTTGLSAFLQSGTPLNQFGRSYFPARPFFLVPRGTAGRTPGLWDLDLRVMYDLQSSGSVGTRRFIIDLRNLGAPRKAVLFEQYRYNSLDGDGNQAGPNPAYLQPLAYQLPMSVRFGVELGW